MSFSRRVIDTPPYLFHRIDEKRKEAQAKGIDVISLAIGDPDRPTPDFVLKLMEEEIRDPRNHVYPSYKGEPDFCEAVANWFKHRFGVELNPNHEVMATIGAKDAVSHLPFAFLDPGDSGLVTDPGYPVYEAAIGFTGGHVVRVPLSEKRGFLPDLSEIDPAAADKAKIMFVNYPNNPTSAVADEGFFEELVAFARKHDLVILSDNAYSEVYFEEEDRPISVMKIPGAKDLAIEIHSFSKTFNMTGWRIGFVVGGKQLIDAFLTLKSNFDSGVFMAIQRVAARALGHPDAARFNRERTALFKARRDKIATALTEMSYRFQLPRASYYFWVRIPDSFKSSVEFCADLLEKQGLVVTPGVGYGPSGEKYFRISMTSPDERIDEGMKRLKEFL
ncbi:MAG: LL-diaminopimelate aminotransferase [Desulfomonile tiedjei]|uniref:Aminotransferase n=1 Tax=Desulfomonile tiedjei TaxID=2358 RepID=A0A9D6Z484_9BACT|nr:LL-diaminopimelate aminotransferase [Desulfomonile tiedjei]